MCMSKRSIMRRLMIVGIDGLLIMIAYALTYTLVFTLMIPKEYIQVLKKTWFVYTSIYIGSLILFKAHRILWRYTSIYELLTIAKSWALAHVIFLFYGRWVASQPVPYRIIVVTSMLSGILTTSYKLCYRIHTKNYNSPYKGNKEAMERVMIIGAGAAGNILVHEMENNPNNKYMPVLFVDDDFDKQGKMISGIPVRGDTHDIPQLVKKHKIDTILFAIPSTSHKEKKKVYDVCKQTGCNLKTLPNLYDMLEVDVLLSKVRSIEVEELLGREPIQLDLGGIKNSIANKTVLVTGGGGSIGSELCRQIASFSPEELIILDNYENNAYDIQQELLRKYKQKINLHTVIASVREKNRLDQIFDNYKPELVFHAAAHKHVPLMEDSPTEAIKNNVFGTLNVAQLSEKHKVEKFVLISTDKAVNPTNIMGATKRICEMIVQGMSKIGTTEFVAVRFGNVLGSNGSVIPHFKKQIGAGGPVTVTHPEITRYFMTIPEATQLVLQAMSMAKGGEIFVLDMGEPVRIIDLAKDLIRLSGMKPEEDIRIEFTGLRPGEKLYEELLMEEEGLGSTSHQKIFVGQPMDIDVRQLHKQLEELRKMVEREEREVVKDMVAKLVPTYVREKQVAV